ncbi:MAG: hypothetical protein ACRC7C_11310, partial [Beijerinckiaceae bacterium]
MAESAQSHSQVMQNKLLESEIKAQSRDHFYNVLGMIIALMVFMASIGLLGFLAYFDRLYLTAFLGFSSIVAIVIAFIKGPKDRKASSQLVEQKPKSIEKKSDKRR